MTAWWNRLVAWLTESKRSTYGVAVTRAICGLVVCTQLVYNWPDRHYTWGDGADWTDPLQSARPWPGALHWFGGLQGGWFDLAYVATILAGLAMMLGWHSRISTLLTLVLWLSLYVSNPFVGSGGDAVLRMALFFLCFTDSGRHVSLDARRRTKGERRSPLPAWFGATLHNAAMLLIVHQVIMVYVGSAFWKLQGERWVDGTAVYYPLSTLAYSPWGDVIAPLVQWSPFVLSASWSAIFLQLFFPVMLIYRSTRFVGLVLITMMHLGIGVLMGIMYFSLAMIAVDMILVSDESWRRGLHWLKVRAGRVAHGNSSIRDFSP